MDATITALTTAGWEQHKDFCPYHDTPPWKVFGRGKRPAFLGPTWATFYDRIGDGGIDAIRSVRHTDAAGVSRLIAAPFGGAV